MHLMYFFQLYNIFPQVNLVMTGKAQKERVVSPELLPLCCDKVKRIKTLLKPKIFYNGYKASHLFL